MNDFAKWETFYGIVGASGGALIGVQFVVVTLLANMRVRPTSESIHAFATPTVVNFGFALLVSSLMSIPWTSLFAASATLAVCGLIGLGYQKAQEKIAKLTESLPPSRRGGGASDELSH
jgi:hypothetical protein